MNTILNTWNLQEPPAAIAAILPCCSSREWAAGMVAARPFADLARLSAVSDFVWSALQPADWEEAFASHPRIGAREVPAVAGEQSDKWSSQEQHRVTDADRDTLEQLRRGNQAYEQRFGRTYIVCASGKSAEELLGILEQRMTNDSERERCEAAEQQRQITQLRLRKWLQL